MSPRFVNIGAWEHHAEWEQQVRRVWEGQDLPLALAPSCFRHPNGCSAMVGREPAGGGEHDPLRWHISVTGPDRIPTWEEMVAAAHDLRPGVVFVVGIPPRTWWMNVHPHVLHAWETTDEQLVREYRVNATGQEPT